MSTLSKEEQFEEAVKEIAYYLRFKLKKEIRELLAPVYADLRDIQWQTERTADRLSKPISMEVVDASFLDDLDPFQSIDEEGSDGEWRCFRKGYQDDV